MTQSFREIQKEFVSAVRSPALSQNKSDEEQRRMGVYQSLFFNNINNFLQSGFPVLHSILDNTTWSRVVRDFFSDHACRSPYFAEISKEFVEYLSSEPACLSLLPPFASELAHYEWLELDVSIRRAPACHTQQTQGVVMSPFASLVSYAYPVHLIGEDYLPDEPSGDRHYYVVYRQQDYSVQFLQVNAMTAMLLQLLASANEQLSEKHLTEQLREAAPQIAPDVLTKGVSDTLTQMREKGVILPADKPLDL
ncbi:HvfC family RiPP maturation protein [Alteromonas halophila]|uniref:DUF2063 domain-containing protein n=1 Tax=Alteromonas halophila TaxID=516698 RepID=A0A918JPE4_9ALTE|nr:putative DNA-binding domain-containing protein [Alteromonas halophila]GGW94613.1 DUF2063 domain-containing protein [Alteromonas halophila]